MFSLLIEVYYTRSNGFQSWRLHLHEVDGTSSHSTANRMARRQPIFNISHAVTQLEHNAVNKPRASLLVMRVRECLITSSTHYMRCNSNHSPTNREATGKQSNGAIVGSCLICIEYSTRVADTIPVLQSEINLFHSVADFN